MSYFKLETCWDNVCLAVTRHFYTLGHSTGIQGARSWGVAGMKILQSVSRVQCQNAHGVETQNGVNWHFRRFSLRSRLEKIAQIMEGAFFKLSCISNSYVYFNASLVTSDWLSWPHSTVAPKMLQQWHICTLLVKKMGNKQNIHLSKRWMDLTMSILTMDRYSLEI